MQQSIKQPTQWRKLSTRRQSVAAAMNSVRPKSKRKSEEHPDEVVRDDCRAGFQSHDSDTVEEHELDDTPAVPAEAPMSEESLSGDDGLGLYLQQMGSVPLLNRAAELEITK